MASVIYNRLFYDIAAKLVNLDTDTIYCALLGAGYTPNKDHNVWADVSGQEIAAGGGYIAGGALMNTSLTEDDVNDRVVFTAVDVEWNPSTITASYAVVYDTTHDTLICCIDFAGAKSSAGGSFKIVWSANGIVRYYQP